MKQTQGRKYGLAWAAHAALAGLMLVTINGAEGAEKMTTADFYVAVSGKDTNPGTSAAPFATLARARDAVSGKIKAGLTKNIVVQVRGGTYGQTETLTFGPEDSGTEKFSITYAAAPGEKVILSGGRKITGWRKGPNEIWTAEIPEVKDGKPALRSPEQRREGEGGWYFRQLFVNGQRAVRGRTPNADDKTPWWKIKSSSARPDSLPQETDPIIASVTGPVKAWGNPSDVELVYISNNNGSRKRLGSVNEKDQTFTLAPPQRWNPKAFGTEWQLSVPGANQSCYLENAMEMLDQPGEWYLNRQTGVLSYWPRPGEDLASAETVAPVVPQTLLAIRGTPERPVANVHFRGIQVEHVEWAFPAWGYLGMAVCTRAVGTDPKPGWEFVDAAVEYAHARSCSFVNGRIAHVGSIGLCLRRGAANIVVEGNEICDTGGNGIGAGYLENAAYGYIHAPPPGDNEATGYRIANNHIHHCGTDDFGACGIILGEAKDSVIAHNLIHDTAYFGIGFAGSQDPKAPFARNNRIEYNHIYKAMQVTSDGAGLYATFAHSGSNNLIRANLIHDSSDHWAAGGLYLDGKCSGVVFDHNVVYGKQFSTFILYGKEALTANTWTGNLLLSNKDETPPEEFVEVMRAFAGLEPAYRKALQGSDPQPCEVDVLEGSAATHRISFLNTAKNEPWEIQVAEGGTAWQFDLSKQERGVVYRMNPHATEGKTVELKLRKLDPAARYTLKAYSAQIVPAQAYHGVDPKMQSPLVQKVAPAPDLGLPASATGRELMEEGLTLKDAAGVIWVAYRKAQK